MVLAWQVGKQVHTSGPDQGCRTDYLPSRTATGPAPLGSASGTQFAARGQMHAARAKSGQSDARSLDGRVREWAGGTRRLHSTARITLIRAGHGLQGPGTESLKELASDPRAGRGVEG